MKSAIRKKPGGKEERWLEWQTKIESITVETSVKEVGSSARPCRLLRKTVKEKKETSREVHKFFLRWRAENKRSCLSPLERKLPE